MSDLFLGVPGGDRMFDGGDTTWRTIVGGGDSGAWNVGAPIDVTSILIKWHYGGAYLQDGSPGSVSGAAGAFQLQGSADGMSWTPVVTDANPVATAGASWPVDFQHLYTFSVVTWQYWRFVSTDGGSNNDIYTISAFGPGGDPPPPEVHVEIEGVHIERPLDVKIRMEQNSAGEGYLAISRGDVQATAANFTPGNVVSVTFPEIDPNPIFEFFLQDGDWNLVSSDEEGGEELRFSGPGTLSILKRAIMAAERYDASAVGAVYPAKGRWEFGENATEGTILNKMLMEATDADRPHHALTGVTWDFDGTNDSNGDPWDGTEFEGRWRVPIGNNLYDEFLRLVAANFISIEMSPGLVLHAYRSRGTDRSSATFAAGKVRFEKAINIADELAKGIAGREFISHALSRWGEDHSQYAWTTKTGSWPYVVEGYNQVETTNLNTVRRVSRGQMGWLEKAQNSIIFTHYVPYPGDGPDDEAGIYLPGQDWTENGRYWCGDNVTVHTGTGDTDYNELEATVYAITIGIDETGYVAPVIVELNAPYQGQLTSNGATPSSPGSSSGAVGGGGSGGSGSPPVLSSAFQPIAEKGEDDGYAELGPTGLVPYDQLGDDGDGSGDNVLHDDGTWQPLPDFDELTSMAWVPVMANDPGIVTTHGEAVYIPWVTVEGEAIMVQRSVV